MHMPSIYPEQVRNQAKLLDLRPCVRFLASGLTQLRGLRRRLGGANTMTGADKNHTVSKRSCIPLRKLNLIQNQLCSYRGSIITGLLFSLKKKIAQSNYVFLSDKI